MSTSKLYIDPAHVAAAEKDDWAKFARLSEPRTELTFVHFYVFSKSALSPVLRTTTLSTTPSCVTDNY
jgi:hypothetical protein